MRSSGWSKRSRDYCRRPAKRNLDPDADVKRDCLKSRRVAVLQHFRRSLFVFKIYNRHGEQGQKSYYNGFKGLAFRKGRFFVSIACTDEKLAERLADYADETISADL
jgi:hypothetical protein